MKKDSIWNYQNKAAAYYYYFGAVDSLGAMSEPRALSMKQYCDTKERRCMLGSIKYE